MGGGGYLCVSGKSALVCSISMAFMIVGVLPLSGSLTCIRVRDRVGVLVLPLSGSLTWTTTDPQRSAQIHNAVHGVGAGRRERAIGGSVQMGGCVQIRTPRANRKARAE